MEFIKSKVLSVLSDYVFLEEFDEIGVKNERIRFYRNCEVLADIKINFVGEPIIRIYDTFTQDNAEDYLGLLTDLKECVKK